MGEINRQLVLKERPRAEVRDTHFEMREGDVPVVDDGQVLLRTLYFSFDPTQRGWLNDVPSYMPPVQIGEPMRAGGVAQVVESRHPRFRAGDVVSGTFSWQDFVLVGEQGISGLSKVPRGVPLTWPLGVLGITGLTAYFGMLELGRPVEGETVVVSGAAGATGSVAGQIARLKGARVIGSAGGPEKCRWLTEVAGFDAAIDYRNENTFERLQALCKNSINVFYDNVGGQILDDCLLNMAQHGRIVLCGGISSGYGLDLPPGPKHYMQLVIRSCRMEGFIVLNYLDRFPEAIEALAGWVKAGQIHFEEDVQEGLENCPATLRRLFEGRNFGKQLLKVAEPPIPLS
ncbi:MAG: NADP-dependent oxidoreductase [Gammaproteobacteria bacterium]|nr:NADP-dependent oxidoreductase [Gammaproteobacteria bacterium]TVQ48604.1 MAG: NADP-dependent oxidoreductase [Gammaproteobacteria bacterium]